MKLHLNLTLRRALMAAMAMVTIHVAQAATTITNGTDSYITGEGTLAQKDWNGIWNKNPKAETLTIGTSQGAASVTLDGKSTYNNGKIVFIGGAGNNSGAATANSGVLNVGAATLNVGTAVYVGNSQHAVTGNLLTINGGSLTAGSQLYVGAWAATGEIQATNATIKVNSGKEGAVFAMGWRESAQGGTDTVTLDKSTITVGAAGGVKDIATVGRGGSDDTLYLNNGSTANFYDQTIVGEKSGSDGTIHVHGGSVMSVNDLVLGAENGANGTICMEDGTLAADLAVVGQGGKGVLQLDELSELTADVIVAGDNATGKGTLEISGGSVESDNIIIGNAGSGTLKMTDGEIVAENITLADVAGSSAVADIAGGELTAAKVLTIGGAGKATVTNAGDISAESLVLGEAETANGSLSTSGSVTADELYVGYKGTGDVTVTGGSLAADDAYITGTDSVLATDGGETKLTNATVLGGTLSTGAAGTTDISGELILAEGGKLINSGTTVAANVTVTDSAGIQVMGGVLETESVVNDGAIQVDAGATWNAESTTNNGVIYNAGTWNTDSVANAAVITNSGIWNASGVTESTDTIVNNGTLNIGGEMNASLVIGEGSSIVESDGKLNVAGQVTQGAVVNDGAIEIQSAGRLEAGVLSGDGATTILVNGATVSTGESEAIIEVGSLETADVVVDIDTENASSLIGKNVDFIAVSGSLVEVDNFVVDSGWTIDWDGNRIYTGDEKSGSQLSFTGDKTGMSFTKLGAVETQAVDMGDLADNQVKVELEVVTETVQTESATLESKGEAITENKTSVEIAEQDTLHSAEITQGVDTETQEDVRTNVIIGKNVESAGDAGAVKVQSVVVNQKTTIETPEGQENIEKKETIGVSGVALVFEGKSEHKGQGQAELGFKEDTQTGTLTTTKKDEQDNVITVQNEVKKVDIVQVQKDAEVSISDMSMHSTHALTVQEGTTITFSGVDLHVGGTTDVNLTDEVEVKVYDENGDVKKDAEGNEITKTEIVDSGAHLTVDTTITKSTVKVQGNSVVKFEKIDDKDHHSHGTTTIKESVVEIEEGSVLGDNAEHMQNIAFTGQSEVTNSGTVNNATFTEQSQVTNTGTVNNATFESGAMLSNNNGSIEDVVFSNGSHLKGKGNAKKVHVDKDSKLTVGSSPGVLNASDLKVDGTTEFYFITNSADWDTGTITADENTGAISQLNVDKAVTLNGAVQFVYQTKVNGEYVTLTGADAEAARREVGSKITEDTEIKFVTGNLKELYLGSGFDVIEETLPILTGGLDWDYATLFADGTITVVSEMLEEPTRIANTLVSAGETVLSFGRLAESQAGLREAGTTRTWGSALGVFNSIDSGNTTNGYDYDAWGAAVGVDHAFTKNTVIGVAFGCTWGENTPEEDSDYYEAGSIDQDAKMVGLYGTHKFRTKGLLNDVKLSAFAAYGWFENDSTRKSLKSGNEAAAEWDSNAWVLSASLSRDISTDDGVVFTPYVGVEYTKATMDDFSETGRSYDAEYTADEDYSNLSVKLGMTVRKDFGGFTPYLGVAYINDVDRSAAEVTAAGKRGVVSGKSALPGRDAFQVKVGANWQLTETLDLNAGYTAEFRNKATEQSANVGIGLTF